MKIKLFIMLLLLPVLFGVTGCDWLDGGDDKEEEDTSDNSYGDPTFGVVKPKTIDDEDNNQNDEQDAIDVDVVENYFNEDFKRVYSINSNGKTIVLLKKIDLNDYRTNPDGTYFYHTAFAVDITQNGKTKRLTLASLNNVDIYTNRSNSNWMLPCMAYETSSKTVSVFQNSKDENYTYSMDGYVYRFDLNNLRVSEEHVFSYANFGWYSYFNGSSSDGKLELKHFSYAGYYGMTSLRDNNGNWKTFRGDHIKPNDFETQGLAHSKTIIINN